MLGLISRPVYAQQPGSSAPPKQDLPDAAKKPKPTKPPLKRVHVDLNGFELEQAAASSPSTQVGGGTRAIGGFTTLLAPRFARVYNAHPIFQWSHTTQAQNFEFRLFDEKGELLYRVHASGRELRYPDDAPALQPGVVYAWNVQPETTLLGGVSATCRFIRVTQAEIDEISEALRQIGSGGKKALEGRAQLFTDRRLWFDAVQAFSDLIGEHADDAELFERRGIVYDQIYVTKSLAEEDFAVADKLRKTGNP